MLLLICKEPVVESSDPVVGSLEVLLVCRAFAEGRDFAGLQDQSRGGQEAYLSWARRGGGTVLYSRQSLGVFFKPLTSLT